MGRLRALLLCGLWLGATTACQSGIINRRSCAGRAEACRIFRVLHGLGNPEICEKLKELAIAEGGVWGSPSARAATHTTGKPGLCLPHDGD